MGILKAFDIRKHEHLAARVFIAIAIGCGILLVGKTVGFIAQEFRARSQVASAFETSGKNGNTLDLYKKHIADSVKKVTQNNPFAGEAQKPSPPQFAGIMGDEVLFNGQWLKVGAEVSGAKILKIDPTFVMVQFGDKQLSVVPEAKVDPNARMAGSGPGRGGPGGDMRRGGDFGGGPGGERGGRGGRGGFGGFSNMSSEERESMRERFMNMSPDERMAYMRQMRENSMRGQ